MDHRDRIESPSVERRRLVEKRMEMVGQLFQRMSEGESTDENSNDNEHHDKKRINKNDCNGKIKTYWLGRLVNIVQHMFP